MYLSREGVNLRQDHSSKEEQQGRPLTTPAQRNRTYKECKSQKVSHQGEFGGEQIAHSPPSDSQGPASYLFPRGHSNTQTHTDRRTGTHTQTHTHASTHTRARTRTRTHTHTHTHKHTHTHTPHRVHKGTDILFEGTETHKQIHTHTRAHTLRCVQFVKGELHLVEHSVPSSSRVAALGSPLSRASDHAGTIITEPTCLSELTRRDKRLGGVACYLACEARRLLPHKESTPHSHATENTCRLPRQCRSRGTRAAYEATIGAGIACTSTKAARSSQPAILPF